MLDRFSRQSPLERHLDQRARHSQQEQNVPNRQEQLLHETTPLSVDQSHPRRSVRCRPSVDDRGAVCVPLQVEVFRRRDEEFLREQQRCEMVRHAVIENRTATKLVLEKEESY